MLDDESLPAAAYGEEEEEKAASGCCEDARREGMTKEDAVATKAAPLRASVAVVPTMVVSV